MTPEEYYRIKADVENELNNEIFGVLKPFTDADGKRWEPVALEQRNQN